MSLRPLCCTLVSLLLACTGTDNPPVPDAGLLDAGPLDAGDLDAGDLDAGPPDAGEDAGELDAGDPDAGDLDAGAPDAGNLDPMRADCLNGGGDETCWQEWLKEVTPPQFTPVARGELGAGAWPVTDLVTMGAGTGLSGGILGVGVDTGENLYAVSSQALFVRRKGEAKFVMYERNTNGLRDYRFLSVAGAGPGVAFVGYEGVWGVDPLNEPAEVRKSGDIQRIELQPGGITATTYDTHNSNTPKSGKYDHSRSIFEIHIPRRGPAAGEVYLGTDHGIVRYQGELYADHLHLATVVDGSQRFGPSRAMTVRDDGTVWYGNDFRFGGKPWTPRRAEWYFKAPWIFPSYGYGGGTDRNYYEGIGVDSTGKHVWVAARTFGMVHLTVSASGRASELRTHSVPDPFMRDLVVDLDDKVWLAADSGLHRYDPATSKWSRLAGVPGNAAKLFLDDTVTPRALYIAHGQGISVYRGP